jgi:hypothetical protein
MKKGLELKTQAREIAADIERHHHDLVRGKIRAGSPSCAEAALTYAGCE